MKSVPFSHLSPIRRFLRHLIESLPEAKKKERLHAMRSEAAKRGHATRKANKQQKLREVL